jgi:hypothetical protein
MGRLRAAEIHVELGDVILDEAHLVAPMIGAVIAGLRKSHAIVICAGCARATRYDGADYVHHIEVLVVTAAE